MLITLQIYAVFMMWLITVLNNIRKGQNLKNKAVSQQNLSYEQYYFYSYSKAKTLINGTVV